MTERNDLVTKAQKLQAEIVKLEAERSNVTPIAVYGPESGDGGVSLHTALGQNILTLASQLREIEAKIGKVVVEEI
jgi:hypothetical protein